MIARTLRLATCLALFAVPAGAGTLAFDFDTDGDPGTIEDTIDAEVGELVEAYLVVEGIPEDTATYTACSSGSS